MTLSYFQEAKTHFIASHQNPINQALHHIVNILVFVGIGYLFIDWRVALLCGVLTQVLAIGGHIVFEKNEPAFKQYPGIVIIVSMIWSFENWFGLRQLLQQTRQESH
uniref:Mpo1-like protein n=1 Tax=Dactylococcopsis salina TaxID=292566 RepID=UPI001E4CC10C|nr:Mpo1-like protein [Dactylococcopsis salina]